MRATHRRTDDRGTLDAKIRSLEFGQGHPEDLAIVAHEVVHARYSEGAPEGGLVGAQHGAVQCGLQGLYGPDGTKSAAADHQGIGATGHSSFRPVEDLIGADVTIIAAQLRRPIKGNGDPLLLEKIGAQGVELG